MEIFDLLCQLVESLASILTYLLSGKPINPVLATFTVHRELEERFAQSGLLEVIDRVDHV
jgi:hypothetical protein